MSRASVSSDTSLTLSETTTASSFAKEPIAVAGEEKRRGLRQRARDLVADMGNPPTKRHDAKTGRVTKNYADMGMLGTIITAKAGKI